MWPYWLMFLVPASMAIANAKSATWQLGEGSRFNLKKSWWWLVIVLTVLIGYRHEVGGDWWNYIRSLKSFYPITKGDIGYRILERLSIEFNWGIYGVNAIGGLLFSLGLISFCRNLPRPWLAISISVPYLVIVVGMGYTRQSIALGLAMLGLVALSRGSVKKFVFCVFFGATFHKSAVLLLPIAALAATRKRIWIFVWIAVSVVGAYLLFLAESVDSLYANYIEAEFHSQGALVRLLMNAVPALFLLYRRRQFEMTLQQMRLWLSFSLISLTLLVAYFFTPSTTALDRVALYMLPLQLAVFCYIPEVLGTNRTRNQLYVVFILIYYATIQLVWLNFANHSSAWLPYNNWFFI